MDKRKGRGTGRRIQDEITQTETGKNRQSLNDYIYYLRK